jgi:hypothetical protein
MHAEATRSGRVATRSRATFIAADSGAQSRTVSKRRAQCDEPERCDGAAGQDGAVDVDGRLPRHVSVVDHPGSHGLGDEPEPTVSTRVCLASAAYTAATAYLSDRNQRHSVTLHDRSEYLVFAQPLRKVCDQFGSVHVACLLIVVMS